MLRAVLDANVFVSGFIQPRGAPGEILRQAVEHQAFQLVISESILAEVRHSLNYPKVRKYLRLPPAEIERTLTALTVVGDVVADVPRVGAVIDDPDDNQYLDAAIEGRADFVVSGDTHLLALREHEGVAIVTPREFLALLEREGAD